MPLAYGELQLKPWEFWRMTPREFLLTLDGFYRREDRAWYQSATSAIWLLMPHRRKGARQLTPERMLGRVLRLMPPRNGDR